MADLNTRAFQLGAGIAFLIAANTLSPHSPRATDLPVREWLVRGPLAADTGRAGLVKDYLDSEALVLPAPGDSAVGGAWDVFAADSLGALDFATAYPGVFNEWSAFYAHTYVRSPDERNVRLVLDSDDDITARVNGQAVWVNHVPRGLGTGSDTVTVRLAAGWNSVLLKVVNRTGGVGVLGRLAPEAGATLDGIALQVERPDGAATHNLPAPGVTVGPLEIDGRLVWDAAGIRARVIAPVRTWGPAPLASLNIRLASGEDEWARTALVEALEPGRVYELSFERRVEDLRDAALGLPGLTAHVGWADGAVESAIRVDVANLLRRLGGRIEVADLAIDSAVMHPGPMAATIVVPEAFAGLVLDLQPMGLGPGASYVVQGEGPRPWENGRVALCGPCIAGDSIALRIEPDGSRPLWATPLIRVRDPGYAEYADGYRYAAALTGSPPSIARPNPLEFLAALGAGDGGSGYAAVLDRYRRAFAPRAEEIRRDTLWLIGNSHIDAAWLWRWDETMDVIENTWRTSLKLSEMFPGYVFAGSSAAYYEMLDREAPGLADSLVAATHSGVWAPVGGWWVEADYNLPSGESLVRQGLYGQRYFERRYGRRSTVAWTPDSFGYPWTVPQILRGSGFEAFVTQKVRWNDSTTFPHNAYYWKGRDGSEIFAYNPYSYVHDLDPDRLVEERLEDRERTGAHDQIVLYGVGDHGGGPTIAMLQRREDAARIPTFPSMHFASPELALNRVERGLPRDSFATWDDELYLEYHRGTYTTQAEIKRRNRRLEGMLQIAESLSSLALSGADYPHDRLESAWRQVLFNQFHDILPGSGIPEVYVDANASYDSAAATLDAVTETAFSSLAGRFHTEAAALGAGNALVVFNPLGWPRAGTIRIVSGADTVLQHVDAVPPFGALAVPIVTDDLPGTPPTAGAGWLENDFLRVEFASTGVVTRIYDKQRGREALRSGGRANVLQIFDDKPNAWDAWNIVTWEDNREVAETAGRPTLHTDSYVAEVVFARGWGASTIRQTLRLRRDEPWLEVDNDIDWREEHKALKVAVEPMASPDSATFEIPYGTIGRSGRPRTQLERAKFEVPGQRWADVSSAEGGLAVLNDSKYGWDYYNGTLRLTLLRSPTWPDSLADRGSHRFRYALFPHAGSWKAAEVHRRAAEFNLPFLARLEPSHAGTADGAGLGVLVGVDRGEARGVNLEWAKRAEDSDALVFRVVEWFGEAAEAELVTECARPTAHRANLLEDPGDVLLTRGPRISFAMRAYEITTLIVECDE